MVDEITLRCVPQSVLNARLWLVTGAITALAAALAGCGGPKSPQQSASVPAAVIGGEVVFEGARGDRPIQGASVEVVVEGEIVVKVATDADGRFRVSELPRVPFKLRVVKGGDYEDYEYSEPLDPSNPNQFLNGRKFLTIRLEGHLTSLTGSVCRPKSPPEEVPDLGGLGCGGDHGEPVADATVRTYPATVEVKTQEDGTYEIRSGRFDSAIDYRVEAAQDGYRSEMSKKLQPRIGEPNEVEVITLVPYELSKTGIVPGVVDNTGEGSGDVTQGDQ
jgi:hypothetical protein